MWGRRRGGVSQHSPSLLIPVTTSLPLEKGGESQGLSQKFVFVPTFFYGEAGDGVSGEWGKGRGEGVSKRRDKNKKENGGGWWRNGGRGEC